MKFCPFCGAALVGGAAPFCAECGRALTPDVKRRPPDNRKPAKQAPPKTKRPLTKSKEPPKPDPVRRPLNPDPLDKDYDGYYNDVKPIDNGHTRDRTDPELVKRIIFLAVGAFVIVIFSVILMYLL